jgi:hypothetical protein
LDDVWQDKAFDSLDLAKGKGSVTLLSTRNQSLLERASPRISQVHMTPLSKEDSWSLFCVHAFRPPSNVPCELEALAQCIAERPFIESNEEVSDEEGLPWFKLHDVMRDLAFYILENDSGTPPAKQLYLH